MVINPELYILDVGHGNCAILKDLDGTIIFDCAPGDTLFATLEQLGVKIIEAILISHADIDHLGGVIGLLTNDEIQVKNVYINPDPRKTELWTDFRYAAKDAELRGTRVVPTLTTDTSGQINAGEVVVEVLSPPPEFALGGVGGFDLLGRKITSNSLSAVVGLTHKEHRIVVLSGDMDEIGLDNLLNHNNKCKTEILVFPHHGGLPGEYDPEQFALKIFDLHEPKVIVFSLDRKRFSNPNEKIVFGIQKRNPSVHLMCTEISNKCLDHLSDYQDHLVDIPSKGRKNYSCCSGSIVVTINGDKSTYYPCEYHKDYVKSIVRKQGRPMCMQIIASPT
jgi:beta-lactamase superfamily II metal-dependent hydrolase